MDRVRVYEERLTTRMIDALREIEGLCVYAHPAASARIGVVSFNLEGFDPHEVAHYLDDQADIMVRSGHHCCIPLMKHLGLPQGTVRASLHLYNTDHDVDALVATLRELSGNPVRPPGA
jgi:cysteine desulfurase/selenocysteine lyase